MGTAQGTGHKAKGKNNKTQLLLSLYLAPCTLLLKAPLLAEPLRFDLVEGTGFSVFE